MAHYLLHFLIHFNSFTFFLWHYANFFAMLDLPFLLGGFLPSQTVLFFYLIPFVLQKTCRVKITSFSESIIYAGFTFDPESQKG